MLGGSYKTMKLENGNKMNDNLTNFVPFVNLACSVVFQAKAYSP